MLKYILLAMFISLILIADVKGNRLLGLIVKILVIASFVYMTLY